MTVEWTRPAQGDLEAMDDYWYPIDPAVADRIIGLIQAAGDFLSRLPRAGAPIDHDDFRKWRVNGTEYVIPYRLMSRKVQVLRIHHSAQNCRTTDQ